MCVSDVAKRRGFTVQYQFSGLSLSSVEGAALLVALGGAFERQLQQASSIRDSVKT